MQELGDMATLPVPVDDHATVPVGDDPPVTVALQVMDDPMTVVGSSQFTATESVVAEFTTDEEPACSTVIVKKSLLDWCVESPA